MKRGLFESRGGPSAIQSCQIPALRYGPLQTFTVVRLRLVSDLHGLEREGYRLGRVLAAAGQLHGSDHRVLQVDPEIILLGCGSRSHRLVVHDPNTRDNSPGCATLGKQRRRRVQNFHNTQVLEIRSPGLRLFSGSSSTISRGLAQAPTERQNVDETLLAGAGSGYTFYPQVCVN